MAEEGEKKPVLEMVRRDNGLIISLYLNSHTTVHFLSELGSI